MTVIHVPRPPKSAMDPSRPVSGLLKAQIQHLLDAERNLPVRYRTDIYTNAIQTEGEAAEYIRQVTEAIHGAHQAQATKRRRPVVKRKRTIEIAAAADDSSARKGKASRKSKKRTAKPKG